jgi:predicted small metal-binding protein
MVEEREQNKKFEWEHFEKAMKSLDELPQQARKHLEQLHKVRENLQTIQEELDKVKEDISRLITRL